MRGATTAYNINETWHFEDTASRGLDLARRRGPAVPVSGRANCSVAAAFWSSSSTALQHSSAGASRALLRPMTRLGFRDGRRAQA
jgi:hypothetical protein